MLKHDPRHIVQVQIMHHLSTFIYNEDGLDTLLIIYYSGHGTPELASGNLDREESDEVIWNMMESCLEKTRADVLEIFDWFDDSPSYDYLSC